MKKISIMLLAVLALFAITACDNSTNEPPVEKFSPSWAIGTYSATVLDNEAKANITDDGFDIQLSLSGMPISISSNGDGVSVSKNEKNDTEKTWDIVLTGIKIMGQDVGNVTVSMTSVTDNQELTGKVELEGSLSSLNPALSNITFTVAEE